MSDDLPPAFRSLAKSTTATAKKPIMKLTAKSKKTEEKEKYSYKTLKKKIEKVQEILKDLDPSDDKYRKMQKKKAEYEKAIKETDEYKQQGGLEDSRERLRREARRLKEQAQQLEEKRKKEQEGARQAEEEEKRRKDEAREEAKRIAEARRLKEEAKRQAEMKAKEEERLRVEEEERQAEEARRRAKEARLKKEAEAKRQAEEEEARRKAQEEERIRAEEEARLKAEEEARIKAEEEEKARLQAAEESRLKAEQEAEEARLQAEEQARLKAEQEEEARRLLQEEERRQQQERERQEAEAATASAPVTSSSPSSDRPAHPMASGSGTGSPKGGMGGLLGAIANKKKQLDEKRQPMEETKPKTIKILDSPPPQSHTTVTPSPNSSSSSPDKRIVPRASTSGNLQEVSQDLLSRMSVDESQSEIATKILQEISATEEYQKKLEKHLNQNGVPIPADISYEVCKDKIAKITEEMKSLHTEALDPYLMEKKYSALEADLVKYSTAMMATDEYAEEQKKLAEEWEESIKADNIQAIRQVRSHMPVNVRSMTEDALTSQPTPNGKMLPKEFAKKFKRSNVLQLLRVNPDDIEKMHPSIFESMRTSGLTLTERRALYEHMKDIGTRWEAMRADKNVERKWAWHEGLKAKFKESLTAYEKHVKEYGPPGNHPYAKRNDPGAGGCPLIGNQCPVKANSVLDYSEDYGFTMEAEYESGSPKSESKSREGSTSNGNASRNLEKKKKDDEAIMAELRERLDLGEDEAKEEAKLLRELFHAEKRTKLLEKQLKLAGIEIPEDDITYAEAKAKVEELTEKVKEIAMKMGGTSDSREISLLEKEYVSLSDELEKYTNALVVTKEYAAEQLEKERQWEESVRQDNEEALKMLRRHMPVDIRDMSEEALIKLETPNGKHLPQKIVRKFKRTNILLLLRMDPSSIEPMHPSSLEGMRTNGLTLTERRALHEHLKHLGAKWKAMSNDKMAERRWMWHESLKSKFKEVVTKYDEHVKKYGPPDNHPYASRDNPDAGGCPLLGNQCPVKADLAFDYREDYGFPAEANYKVETVTKNNLLTMDDIRRMKEEEENW